MEMAMTLYNVTINSDEFKCAINLQIYSYDIDRAREFVIDMIRLITDAESDYIREMMPPITDMNEYRAVADNDFMFDVTITKDPG